MSIKKLKNRKMLFQLCSFLSVILFINTSLFSNEPIIDPKPTTVIYNPSSKYSLINSINFHHNEQIFCITCTHANQVLLYKINSLGRVKLIQKLKNPFAKLSEPQYALFSPDGEKIVVANWTNQTLTIYRRRKDHLFEKRPASILSAPSYLKDHKPHGMAFSPCGNYFAVAYGAANYYDTAIALFLVSEKGYGFELIHMLHGSDDLPGIPKGITFSPDGTCLLVTFCDVNSLIIYNLSEDKKLIDPIPKQVIQGRETRIFRPEDIKISPKGNYCAITNSNKNTVTFYPFDKTTNRITQSIPCDILENPKAGLCFPHGIAFSPDGSFFLTTQFGRVSVTKKGDITWDHAIYSKESKCNLYRLLK
jgi:DNA-binding beta-propeller fold protein YncE